MHVDHEATSRASSGAPVGLQVAERTVADKKGGHLTKRKSDGRLLLRESAMVSDGDKAAFEDTTKCGTSLMTGQMQGGKLELCMVGGSVTSCAEVHHLMATRLRYLHRHKFFNTNNLWVNLDKLQATLDEQGGLLKLPLIKNKKTVRDTSAACYTRTGCLKCSCTYLLFNADL